MAFSGCLVKEKKVSAELLHAKLVTNLSGSGDKLVGITVGDAD